LFCFVLFCIVVLGAQFLKAGLLRATGNVPKAIEAFKQVLLAQPDHLDAHDHLYGVTCGLLPVEAGEEEVVVVRDYVAGRYGRVCRALMSELWIISDAQLVLLTSALTCTRQSAQLYELSQQLVEER
jgi:hypothetical protein